MTGGENGLGGISAASIGPFNLDNALNYYIVVAVLCLGVLYLLLRLVRSPFGHVLVAIRENEQRATFLGYPTNRYKLVAFVISAVVTGFAGALLGFQNHLVSADPISVSFSGELLAMVVIGGMRSFLGPALGALFFILFRELFSIWTAELAVLVRPDVRRLHRVFARRPGRLWATAQKRWWPAAGRSRRDEPAQDLRRPAAAGLPDARRHSTAPVLEVARRLQELRRHPRRRPMRACRSAPARCTR